MENAMLIEKLNDIREIVDSIRNSVAITELDWVYDDLIDLLEEYE